MFFRNVIVTLRVDRLNLNIHRVRRMNPCDFGLLYKTSEADVCVDRRLHDYQIDYCDICYRHDDDWEPLDFTSSALIKSKTDDIPSFSAN